MERRNRKYHRTQYFQWYNLYVTAITGTEGKKSINNKSFVSASTIKL